MKVQVSIPTGRHGLVFRHAEGTWKGPAHQHKELEINIGLAGRAWLLIENKRVRLFQRDLVWLFPQHNHMIIEQTDDFCMLVVVFRPVLVREGMDETRGIHRAGAKRPVLQSRCLSPADFETLSGIWTSLIRGEATPYFNAGLAWLYREAWRCYDAAEEDTLPGEVHPAVEKAALWLRHHPETASLAEVARRVGVSSPWLSRLFKKQMGVSLVRFRNEQRLQHFRSHYGTGTRHTLTEAAYASGFNTYTQFFRAYRRSFGQSPSQRRPALEREELAR